MDSKLCCRCEIEKPLGEYHKGYGKFGKASYCKDCKKLDMIKWKENNPDYHKKYSKNYRVNNPEKVKRVIDKWKDDNPDYHKKYRVENRDKINNYIRERRNCDDRFRLTRNLRTMVGRSFKNGGYPKDFKTYEIIGCSYEKLVMYLNNNPYGFICGADGIDVDHITPLSVASNEKDLILLNHYTNLQLLPSEYNRYVKINNQFDRENFEKWLTGKVKTKE